MNQLLKKSDYKNLLEFSNELLKTNGAFLDTALKLLSQYFEWNLSLYYILDRQELMQKPIMRIVGSENLEPTLITRLKKIYANDVIVHSAIERQRRSNDWKGVFLTQSMIDPVKYAKSDFDRLLSCFGIKYTAVCLISLSPEIKINIFKTESEGPFTSREIELLKAIQNTLAIITAQRIQLEDREIDVHLLSQIRGNETAGYVVVDSFAHAIWKNSSFTHLAFEQFGCSDTSEQICCFLELFEKDGVQKLWTFQEPKRLIKKNVEFCIIPGSGPTGGLRGNYCGLVIRKKTADNDEVDRALLTQYQLSSREAQVLSLVKKGYSNQEIADQLYLSIHTVKSHMTKIYTKLHTENRVTLLALLQEERKSAED